MTTHSPRHVGSLTSPARFFCVLLSLMQSLRARFHTSYRYYRSLGRWRELHDTNVIRTGPREVTVYRAEAIPHVLGAKSKCKKGLRYATISQVPLGGKSLQTTRDKGEHRQRRRLWDRAFSATALREYEHRLDRHALLLMLKLKQQVMQLSVRFTKWFNLYSFDAIGDVGFSHSSGMMEERKEADMIKQLHESMSISSIFNHFSWALNLILHVRRKWGPKYCSTY